MKRTPFLAQKPLAILLLLLLLLPSCQAAYLFAPDATEKIEPEYRVEDGSIAVVVWTDQSTRDEYPRVGKQLCLSLTHQLKENLKKATIIPARDVIRMQEESGLDWASMSTNELCDELECDHILRVDVEEFTTRASKTPHLRKARVDATLNLYKKSDEETIDSVYRDSVHTMYPPETKHGAYDMDERDLIHSSIEFFSMTAARKFYAHEILLEDKRD